MPFTLRPAVAADMAEIMRLERAGFAEAIQETEEAFAERLSAAPEGCWVLQGEAGRLFGYLCAEFWQLEPRFDPARFARNHAAADTHALDGEEVYVSSMVVDPATRGTGWGRRLFRDALAEMFARHPRLRSTILIVNPEWLAARQIYRAEGFIEIGEIGAYFASADGQRLPAIVMRRD
ncbi:ribosomal-protein-alanine N-acetyltransferase [Duganella sp. CF458]|uniref:GNAT family N-acetyltransferase n=1 Tax=Duganella sp. CF458 TaxID=1884368 RepID=UPI0008DF79AD|nr:N-acetyltransferase [Duganella sp. CF458]SFF78448.1 ribosomal-protein-alanine N-acetyltransferase [Duganella sp. CF458]